MWSKFYSKLYSAKIKIRSELETFQKGKKLLQNSHELVVAFPNLTFQNIPHPLNAISQSFKFDSCAQVNKDCLIIITRIRESNRAESILSYAHTQCLSCTINSTNEKFVFSFVFLFKLVWSMRITTMRMNTTLLLFPLC